MERRDEELIQQLISHDDELRVHTQNTGAQASTRNLAIKST